MCTEDHTLVDVGVRDGDAYEVCTATGLRMQRVTSN